MGKKVQHGQVPRWLFQSDCSDAAVRVYAYLAWLASPGDECTVRVDVIGAHVPKSGKPRSKSTVRQLLSELVSFGAIQRLENAGHSSTFRVFRTPLNVVAVSQRELEFPVDNVVDNSVDKRVAHG